MFQLFNCSTSVFHMFLGYFFICLTTVSTWLGNCSDILPFSLLFHRTHAAEKESIEIIYKIGKPKADFFKIQLNFTSIYKSQIWNNFFEGLSEWSREKNNCLQSSSINYRWAIFTFGVKINNRLALERSQ